MLYPGSFEERRGKAGSKLIVGLKDFDYETGITFQKQGENTLNLRLQIMVIGHIIHKTIKL